ncbi:MAG: hypothetical protein OEY89_02400 [Gammaproteobacteria bacterium]|nr:hypothetical protein [Gammaproteobacteria bacterium]
MKVQLPDGKIAQFPDDMPIPQVEAAIKAHLGGGQEKATQGPIDYLSGLADEVANTGSFGMGDRVKAAGQMAADFIASPTGVKKWDDYVAKQQADRMMFRNENPKGAFTASMVGAMANPGASKIANWMTSGPTTVNNVLRGAAGGAGMGFLQGAGESQGPLSKRLGEGAQDAVGGAVIGGGMPIAGKVVGPLAKALVDGVKKGAAQAGDMLGILKSVNPRFADRKILEALKRDGYESLDDVAARLKELGPEATIADLGENLNALTFQTYARPGEGKPIIRDLLTSRQEGVRTADGLHKGGQTARIENFLDEKIPETSDDIERAIQANRALKEDLYGQAYKANKNIEDTTINRIIKTPEGKTAFKLALRDMQSRGKLVSVADPELTALAKEEGITTGKGVGDGLTLEFLDSIKKHLGNIEQGLRRNTTDATAKSRAAFVSENRKAFTRRLDELDKTAQAGPNSLKPEGGAYAQARKVAQEDFTKEDALDMGVKFMTKNMNSREIEKRLAEMNTEQRHAFRVGAADALKTRLNDTRYSHDAIKKMMGMEELERKIDLAFGDRKLFSDYIKMLQAEERMFRTKGKVLGGSETAERQMSLEDGGIDPGAGLEAIKALSSNNPGQWLSGIKHMWDATKSRYNIPQGVSGELARRLMGRDIAPLAEMSGPSLVKKYGLIKPGRLTQGLIGTTVTNN